MEHDFLGGVVEGFYGQPWTQAQRLVLFDRMAAWGLNTYFYSPKDDLKHRAIWRECYTDEEMTSLTALVNACGQRGLRFIFGLCPGLDICFSDEAELACIRTRFEQLIDIGVRDFALLFDDLPGGIRAEDLRVFESVAAAQCSVANSIFHWLRSRFSDNRLLFCPTPYCGRMDRWELGGADYLDTVGRTLTPEIDVLWTGPEIISESITIESIRDLADRIGRKPVIWDNLHANDYDLRRLYCGPYSGRPPEMLESVRGILTNPNNEFWINFIPLRTLAHFIQDPHTYDPRQAFLSALSEWSDDFQTVTFPIEERDLRLLADCYYLPHEHGEHAQRLKTLVTQLVRQPIATWGEAHDEFLAMSGQILRIFDQLTQLKNRELFYAWSRRVWELREELELISSFLECKKKGELSDSGFASETHLPKTYRGGMVAELQHLLVMDAAGKCRTVIPTVQN